jgi:hypothetical protein
MATTTQIRGSTQIMANSVTPAVVSSGVMIASGANAMTGALNMGSQLVNFVANGVSSTDAVNLGQVQALVEGVTNRLGARCASNTETIQITSGNATGFTGLTVDGVTVAIGDPILVPNAPATTGACGGSVLSSQPANGLYTVTGITTNITMTRSIQMAASVGPFGALVYVVTGPTWGSVGLAVTTPNNEAAFTYGTGNIGFTQWNGLADVTTGNVLTKSGNQISVNTMATGTAIIGNAGTPTITAITGAITLGATGVVTAVPSANNTYALGSSTNAFTGAYLSNGGTNITSLVSGASNNPQTLTLPATATSDTLVGRASTDTLTNKTITAAVLSGSFTGTYTLAGTPTLTSPTINSPTLTTPVLGTPSSGTLTSCTGLPLAGLLAAAYNTVPTASTLAEWDANKNISANNMMSGYTTTNTSSLPVTLTVGSTMIQVFTGSTAGTLTLPTTSVVAGMQYLIINASSALLTIQSSAAATVVTMAGNASGPPWTMAMFTARIATPTAAADWYYKYSGELIASGKSPTFSNSITFAGTDATTMTFPSTSATIARTDAANTFTGVQTMTSPAITTPAFSGTATGTYTLGGTPTITSPTINSATMTAPALGTVASGVITACTGSPTLTAPLLGTPASGVLTNCTGLPLAGLASAAYNTTPTASTLSEWDANLNLSSNVFALGVTSTATAGGTTNLTVGTAAGLMIWTGTTTQTVTLPTTGVVKGAQYSFINQSTASLTVQSSAAGGITVLTGAGSAPYQACLCTALAATPTTAAQWSYVLYSVGGGGSVSAVSVASSNGFAGSSSGGATPALTLTTSVTGVLYGNGTSMAGATGANICAPSTSHGLSCNEVCGGSGTAWTVANTPAAPQTGVTSMMLFQNGLLLRQGASYDYTIAGTAITLNTTATAGDILIATYWY